LKTLTIELFADVLCIWAYGSQIRIDQLKADYGNRITLQYRFIPVFAAAHERIQKDWGARGSFKGYSSHMHEVATQWDHVVLHPELWMKDPPRSSSVAHLYLKALQSLQRMDELPGEPVAAFNGRTVFEEFMWRIRCAFFEQARNISRMNVLDEVGAELDLPQARIHELISNGDAHAELHLDTEARDLYQVPGSPTLIFNEGRQRLYGNIGYRIIDANIAELLDDTHHGGASWC